MFTVILEILAIVLGCVIGGCSEYIILEIMCWFLEDEGIDKIRGFRDDLSRMINAREEEQPRSLNI